MPKTNIRHVTAQDEQPVEWFAMRDLKRSNAKTPAYKVLPEKYGIEAFTPLKWILAERAGKTERRQVPFISDLLFVKASRLELDPVVESIATLQYRYVKGQAYRQPLTVRTADMEWFIDRKSTRLNSSH